MILSVISLGCDQRVALLLVSGELTQTSAVATRLARGRLLHRGLGGTVQLCSAWHILLQQASPGFFRE